MSYSPRYPEPYIVGPASDAVKSSIILLHGTSLQGQIFGDELLKLFPTSSVPLSFSSAPSETSLATLLPDSKFIFPSGSLRRTTVFGGALTNAWFDVEDFEDRTKGEMAQVEGLRESVKYLRGLIKGEVENGEVVFGGFSMGCAMGVFMLLSGELDVSSKSGSVKGYVGWSGWLPFRKQIEEVARSAGEGDGDGWRERRKKVRDRVRELLGLEKFPPSENVDAGMGDDKERNIEVWLGHGVGDKKVRLEWGRQMKDVLELVGYQVNWNEYEELEHWYSVKELRDLAAFSSKVLDER